jgi:Fe-S-cluster-containing hydrogenase component 2
MAMTLDTHPTVLKIRQKAAAPVTPMQPLSARWLIELARDCGAADAGVVSLDRPELADQKETILKAFPGVKSLLSFVVRMNREPVKSVNRSISNLEFHHTTDEANDVARELVRRLDAEGVRAVNPPSGFPMEMTNFPGKIWVVSHKPVAVAAGLGRMGIHRNVIHPVFGNFIILATVLLWHEVDEEAQPIDYNPCLSCKLCVAACPVGAIHTDGHFDPSACLTHNYREFMSGFTDWVEQVVDSPNKLAYRQKVTDQETASVWQSLSFGANYKAAYCLAVCPAGEDVIGPFLDNRGEFVAETVKPLQKKIETIYVVPKSDAEEHVKKTFPHKKAKPVNGVRPTSIEGFIGGMPIIFQRGQSKGINATYHFTFHGISSAICTVNIRDQKLEVLDGLHGTPDCAVTADAATWLGFLRKERSIVWAIIRGKVNVKGPTRLLNDFGRCFPS